MEERPPRSTFQQNVSTRWASLIDQMDTTTKSLQRRVRGAGGAASPPGPPGEDRDRGSARDSARRRAQLSSASEENPAKGPASGPSPARSFSFGQIWPQPPRALKSPSLFGGGSMGSGQGSGGSGARPSPRPFPLAPVLPPHVVASVRVQSSSGSQAEPRAWPMRGAAAGIGMGSAPLGPPGSVSRSFAATPVLSALALDGDRDLGGRLSAMLPLADPTIRSLEARFSELVDSGAKSDSGQASQAPPSGPEPFPSLSFRPVNLEEAGAFGGGYQSASASGPTPTTMPRAGAPMPQPTPFTAFRQEGTMATSLSALAQASLLHAAAALPLPPPLSPYPGAGPGPAPPLTAAAAGLHNPPKSRPSGPNSPSAPPPPVLLNEVRKEVGALLDSYFERKVSRPGSPPLPIPAAREMPPLPPLPLPQTLPGTHLAFPSAPRVNTPNPTLPPAASSPQLVYSQAIPKPRESIPNRVAAADRPMPLVSPAAAYAPSSPIPAATPPATQSRIDSLRRIIAELEEENAAAAALGSAGRGAGGAGVAGGTPGSRMEVESPAAVISAPGLAAPKVARTPDCAGFGAFGARGLSRPALAETQSKASPSMGATPPPKASPGFGGFGFGGGFGSPMAAAAPVDVGGVVGGETPTFSFGFGGGGGGARGPRGNVRENVPAYRHGGAAASAKAQPAFPPAAAAPVARLSGGLAGASIAVAAPAPPLPVHVPSFGGFQAAHPILIPAPPSGAPLGAFSPVPIARPATAAPGGGRAFAMAYQPPGGVPGPSGAALPRQPPAGTAAPLAHGAAAARARPVAYAAPSARAPAPAASVGSPIFWGPAAQPQPQPRLPGGGAGGPAAATTGGPANAGGGGSRLNSLRSIIAELEEARAPRGGN